MATSRREDDWRVTSAGDEWRYVWENGIQYREWRGDSRLMPIESSSVQDSSMPRSTQFAERPVTNTPPRHHAGLYSHSRGRFYQLSSNTTVETTVAVTPRPNRHGSTSSSSNLPTAYGSLSHGTEQTFSAHQTDSSLLSGRHNRPSATAPVAIGGLQYPLPLRPVGQSAGRDVTLSSNPDRRHQGQTSSQPVPTRTNLSEPLLSFSVIEQSDFARCRAYIAENDEILEGDLQQKKRALLAEAVQAQREGRNRYVRACIQKAIILDDCSEMSEDGIWEYLDDLVHEKRRASDHFYENFDAALEKVKVMAGTRRAPTVPAAEVEQTPTTGRHSSFGPNVFSLPSISESQIEFKGTDGEEEKLDKKYKKRGDPEDFFQIGRVFALLWHENAGNSKNSKHGKPVFTTKGKYGENIFSHIRRMVVVRQRYGYCWCISINSYGGRGVAKDRMSQQEVEAHTIIYMSSAAATRSPEERGMNKEPIAVDMAPKQTLDKWSRLNFAKVHTVEHSVKVMNVGTVYRAHMPRLEGYWRNEMVGNTRS